MGIVIGRKVLGIIQKIKLTTHFQKVYRAGGAFFGIDGIQTAVPYGVNICDIGAAVIIAADSLLAVCLANIGQADPNIAVAGIFQKPHLIGAKGTKIGSFLGVVSTGKIYGQFGAGKLT